MVTIEVDDEVWRQLTMQKDPGDSFNDVLRRELGLDDSERDPKTEPERENIDSGANDAETALYEWEPAAETDAKRARRETLRAYRWLCEQPMPQTRSAFQEALAGDADLGERSWWDRAVQPGLRYLEESGFVEYRPGYHDYSAI